ncbi:hypothetical protein Acr_13g0016490 [Actinidia rufa]|uniref:Uncharacterized protein n=1 Tax=Actinidia rufa TaxID=165716 RepID=A0A7J0FQ06_9ERIC|nr:hypothetical protein Acr_13g0016490 [Actinidia rufa]
MGLDTVAMVSFAMGNGRGLVRGGRSLVVASGDWGKGRVRVRKDGDTLRILEKPRHDNSGRQACSPVVILLLSRGQRNCSGATRLVHPRQAALLRLADAVPALSCEASGADVSAFNSIKDSGDGYSTTNDEIAVSGDLKVQIREQGQAPV